jgi:hypothetical protein
MRKLQPHILIVVCLIAGTGYAPAQTPAGSPDSAEAVPAPRKYFIEADTLDEEIESREERYVEEALKLQREAAARAAEDAAEELEALKELESLEILKRVPPLDVLVDVPGLPDEIILPDTVYTTEITIGPQGIEYYDTSGDRKLIVGRPVSPDAPFAWSAEGGRMITTKRAADIVQVGVDVYIDRDERVEGNVVVIGGKIEVMGEIKGDAVAILGDVLVEGYVHGNAVAPTGTVEITSSGKVRRDVVASVIEDRPGSRIGGKKNYTGVRLPVGPGLIRGLYLTMFLIQLGLAVFLIFLILLGHVFAGKNIAAIKSRASESGFKSFVIGLITITLGVPVLFVLLLITVIGIPVAILVLPLAVVLAMIFGYAAIGLRLGEKFAENTKVAIKSQLGRTMAGVTAMLLIFIVGSVLIIVPFTPIRVLGWIFFGIGHAVTFIAMTTGVGAVVLTRFGTRPNKDPVKKSAPAPAALPPDSSESPLAPA